MKNDNSSNDGFIELWGHEFKRVKDGLDEEQIISYVDELINERDSLIKRQEHLSSLSLLAERTIAEADNVAKQIKDDATAKAEAEAREVIAKAEEQARQMMEEKKAEVITKATEEAEAIKASAQREAESLKEEKVKQAQSELKSIAKRLYQELLSQLDNLKQQVISAEANFEPTLSQPETTNPATVEEINNIVPVADLEADPEVSESTSVETSDQPSTSLVDEGEQPPFESQEPAEYEGEVELEILPPIEMRKIMAIISYLDSLAEVRSTELIPLADRPLIKVSLREPMHLTQTLMALPEVGQAEEVVEDEQRRIQLTLTEPSILDDSRRKLNDEVIQLLSQ